MSIRLRLAAVGLILLNVVPLFAEKPTFSDEDIVYFERKIRPLLSERCVKLESEQSITPVKSPREFQ